MNNEKGKFYVLSVQVYQSKDKTTDRNTPP